MSAAQGVEGWRAAGGWEVAAEVRVCFLKNKSLGPELAELSAPTSPSARHSLALVSRQLREEGMGWVPT